MLLDIVFSVFRGSQTPRGNVLNLSQRCWHGGVYLDSGFLSYCYWVEDLCYTLEVDEFLAALAAPFKQES
jgi:hypothetical protein